MIILMLYILIFRLQAAVIASVRLYSMSQLYGLQLSKRKAGGYNIASARLYTKSGNLIEDRESLLCGDCELLLRDPQQLLVCGTRICRTCLEERLKQK